MVRDWIRGSSRPNVPPVGPTTVPAVSNPLARAVATAAMA